MTLLDARDPEAIARAADALGAGELVAFPTETVYGLGARADREEAVARIFAAKGRPADHPLILHVAGRADADVFAASVSPAAERLIAAFWPGPLTVIVARRSAVAEAAAGRQATIGLRSPAHPVARALLTQAKQHGVQGVAAPSANRFGRISPTLATHVADEFSAHADPRSPNDGVGAEAGAPRSGPVPGLLILDGGACPVGIESAIVDCSRGRPVLLRPGTITRARIEAALGGPLGEVDADAPRAPGTLAAHYAPRAKLRLMPSPMLKTAVEMLGNDSLKLAVYSRTLPLNTAPGIRHRRMPGHAEQAAQELFSVLRELDDEGARLIWVEEPPAGLEWDGVRDRLRRAAAA